MIKAVIYDLDDLMVNSIGLHEKAWRLLLKEYQADHGALPADLRSSFVGRRIIDILQVIKDYFNLPATLEDLYQKRTAIFLALVREKLTPMPGLKASLDFFKDHDFKIALATSAAKSYYQLVLEKFGLEKYFAVIVCGDDVKTGKPHPETYLVACQKLGLPPGDCVVLEDATNGIAAANAAGCKCIAVRNPHTPPQDLGLADIILDSLEQINLALIAEL